MPLGRFAAYFLLLMTVCLVAFPRAVGSPPPSASAVSDTSNGCVEDPDSSAACDAPLWRPHSLRHAAHLHVPSLRPRQEAGPAGLPAGLLSDAGQARRPLDS